MCGLLVLAIFIYGVFSKTVNSNTIVLTDSVNGRGRSLNQKFFNLTKEKQKSIIDAGYRVFFMLRAYYEEDLQVAKDIAEINNSMMDFRDNNYFKSIDKSKFKDDVDLEELFNMMNWCVEGYMKKKCKTEPVDLNELEKGYIKMLDFFKRNSYKEEYLR